MNHYLYILVYYKMEQRYLKINVRYCLLDFIKKICYIFPYNTDTWYQRLFWENCYELQNINDTNRNVVFFYLNFATYAPSGLFAACIRRSISRSKIRRIQIRLWSSDAIPHMCDALGVGKSGWRREKQREKERRKEAPRVDARVTLLSRIEKNYHIMQIRAWTETPPVRSAGPRLLATDESW